VRAVYMGDEDSARRKPGDDDGTEWGQSGASDETLRVVGLCTTHRRREPICHGWTRISSLVSVCVLRGAAYVCVDVCVGACVKACAAVLFPWLL
jgi:hypothetical protein